MDNLTEKQRRKTMRAVRQKDSKIELELRRALWKKGFRYRKNYSKLIGKPDIVFVSLRIAIFCDSEFWHGYDWNGMKYKIKSNREFWWNKIEGNITRDQLVNKELDKQGWRVIRFWGDEIIYGLDDCVSEIEDAIRETKIV